jgi:signal transduction histidine kinase
MRSLRLRLILFAAMTIAVALWAAWHVMGMLFEHYTEQRMAITLTHEGNALIAATSIGADGVLHVDPRDIEARTRRPASGMYWEVLSPAGAVRSASLAGKVLTETAQESATRVANWDKNELPGPFETDLIAVERETRIAGVPVRFRIGEDDEPLDRARASFSREMGIFLFALGLALAIAAWAQVELGLLPLRRVRRELEAMERNPAERLSDQHPVEIAALTNAINALADARSEDLARARRRAGDLAHALKTPLAALAAQNRLARAAGATDAAEAIDQTLGAAAAVLEAEMARARAAASRFGGGVEATRPAALIEGLFAVLERTEHGMNLVFDIDVPTDWRIRIDADSFAEILGNILDNAARHARRVVRVSAVLSDASIDFLIDDDGPGIPEERRVEVLRRGVRLDESGGGHGLGLAIVADLAEATGGTVTLAQAPGRGLRVRLRWPSTLLSHETSGRTEDGEVQEQDPCA